MLAKKPKGATQKRRGSGVASLIWMFVGAIITLMIGLFLYLWNPFDMGAEVPTLERKTVQPLNQAEQESGDYEFYDLLPEQEIINIPDEAVTTEALPDNSIVELTPDVVVNVPQSATSDDTSGDNSETGGNTDNGSGNNAANSANNSSSNYGISEETILNPMHSQTGTDNQPLEDDNIVIIEEEGTYDSPNSDNATSQGVTSIRRNGNNSNGTGQNGSGQNGTGQNSSGRKNNAQNGAGSASITASNPTKKYILQINSFSNAEEADKRRAQVLMAGVDARVVKNKMQDGRTFYQVISPQMTSRQEVGLAQQKLQNNGIDSLIVEQRY